MGSTNKPIQIALMGNPNSGKTTLFNALTKDNQRVGNWPGVTVEKKTGRFSLKTQEALLIDLPGLYSLSDFDEGNQESVIASNAVVDKSLDLIINVVDASHLERHLFLTTQLMELKKPLIVVVNMMDVAQKRGITVDINQLAIALKVPVVAVQAHRGIGLDALMGTITSSLQAAEPLALPLSTTLTNDLMALESRLQAQAVKPNLAFYMARRSLEGGRGDSMSHDADLEMADARYRVVHDVVALVRKNGSARREQLTAKIDRFVLNRLLGLPLFFAMMYLLFVVAIQVGMVFQDFFNLTSEAVFVSGASWVLHQLGLPEWIIALCANGAGKGINTTVTFIPVMAVLFFFLSFLEASGYMARAAFVIDRLMRYLGLSGKSFVPMIIGFGCNVPAIMSARIMDSKQEKWLTIAMLPYMSCSARLALYSVFVTAFFPNGGYNIIFCLYLLGIAMAVITGLLLRRFAFAGKPAPLILELPAYHQPSIRRLFKETGFRLRVFLVRAGKLIIPVCIVLGGLNSLTLQGTFVINGAGSDSILATIGRFLTPLFSPMGVSQDNWPATVGLLTGVMAKEVVIGTLNTLYLQVDHFSSFSGGADFWGLLHQAVLSIPAHWLSLSHSLLHPFQAATAPETLPVYGVMVRYFDGQAGAFAYLLFILLYIPCISTMAVMRQEANAQLMRFSMAWSFFVAYGASVLFYQLATVVAHPLQTTGWCAFFILMGLAITKRMSGLSRIAEVHHAP